MRIAFLLVILGVVAAGCTMREPPKMPTSATAQQDTQVQAVAEITTCGGRVEREGGTPDGPVVSVVFDFENTAKMTMDDGLKHIKSLNRLRTLIVRHCGDLTDAGIEHLKGLNTLQVIVLENGQITDVGLQYLRELNQLQELDLSYISVTDVGLEHLQGLNQLHRLNLRCTNVTDEGVKKLQEALPNCKITH